jgi:NurA domain
MKDGIEHHNSLARVEIPAWVAEDEKLLNLLHYVLIVQCRQMGARPYPYAIHRAHEVAVVSFDEKAQLHDMIVGEWRQQGVTVDDISNKQAGKDASGGKKRYK